MGVLYVDESGDPGFEFRPGDDNSSSELLVLGSVYFPTNSDLQRWRLVHAAWDRTLNRSKKGDRREFKFSQESEWQREGFLRAALLVRWRWNVVVIRKTEMDLRLPPERIYREAAWYLLNNAAQRASEGTLLRFDARSFSDDARKEFRDRAEGEVNVRPAWEPQQLVKGFYAKPIRFMDSADSVGVQLADAIAGSAQRAHRTWKEPNRSFLDLITEKTGYAQVWPTYK